MTLTKGEIIRWKPEPDGDYHYGVYISEGSVNELYPKEEFKSVDDVDLEDGGTILADWVALQETVTGRTFTGEVTSISDMKGLEGLEKWTLALTTDMTQEAYQEQWATAFDMTESELLSTEMFKIGGVKTETDYTTYYWVGGLLAVFLIFRK